MTSVTWPLRVFAQAGLDAGDEPVKLATPDADVFAKADAILVVLDEPRRLAAALEPERGLDDRQRLLILALTAIATLLLTAEPMPARRRFPHQLPVLAIRP